jgi:Spy/CpxP family protein refolding chaperone
MRKNTLIVWLMAMLLLGMAPGAWGFGSQGGRGPAAEKRLERIIQELGLTKEQKEKYLAGAKQIEEEAKAIRSQNREIFGKIEKEMLKDTADRQAIHNYIQQINQNNAKMQIKRMDQILELRKELTPEQKTKLEKLTAERKGRRAGRLEKPKQKKRDK